MAIIYNKEKRIFSLHTEHTTYQMMADAHDYLLHLYYGKRLDSVSVTSDSDLLYYLPETNHIRCGKRSSKIKGDLIYGYYI